MTKKKIYGGLIVTAVIDTIIPVPILAIILIHAVATRPDWFVKSLQTLRD